MKNILIFLAVLFVDIVMSQTNNNEIVNQTCILLSDEIIDQFEFRKKSSSCLHTSNYWNDDSLYIPSSNKNSIYLKLNFIFLTKPDGTGNFEQYNSEHIQVIDDMIQLINWRFSTLVDANSSTCYSGSQSFVPHTKIQVVVNKIWKVDPAWDLLTTGYLPANGPLGGNQVLYPPSQNYYYSYFDNDSTIPEGVDFVFPNNGDIYQDLVVNQNYTNYYSGFTGETWAASQFPTTSNLTSASRQIYPDLFNNYIYHKEVATVVLNLPWSQIRAGFISRGSKTIPHEIGHTLWLGHQNQCAVSLMNATWNSAHNYLKPEEIGKMHRASSITNVRQFFTDDSYTNSEIEVATNESWDFNSRMYSDVRIINGNELDLSCSLILPPQSRIIVEDNSILQIDGANLDSSNHTSWEGIKVEGSGSAIILPGTLIDNGYFYAYTDNSPLLKRANNEHKHNVDHLLSESNFDSLSRDTQNNLLVYPNPFKDEISLRLNNKLDSNLKIKIINNLGITVFSKLAPDKYKTLNLSNLANGVYYLTVEDNNKALTKLIIKEK